MLHELSIENFILIDKITMVFDSKLNLLSGETGAGKSILIDAMGFVLGKKPDKTLIRSGQERAMVQAVFHLNPFQSAVIESEYGISADDGLLVIQREMVITGRSTARINGLIVTGNTLEPIGELLVDFHGQHAHQSLLHPKNHLSVLDAYAGESLLDLKRDVHETAGALNELDKAAAAFGSDTRSLRRRLEVLDHEIQEIESVRLVPGEDLELEEQHETFRNMEEIISTLHLVGEILDADETEGIPVLKGLSEVTRKLGQISTFNGDIRQYETGFSELYHDCSDMVTELKRYTERLYFDEELYQQVTLRLDQLNHLKRKYGSTIESILDHQVSSQQEYDQLLVALEALEHYSVKRQELVDQYRGHAEKLTALRIEAAKGFEKALLKELRVLNLPNAKLRFQHALRKHPWDSGIHSEGADLMEILISMNAGESLKPLKSVASGGELSRLMLALKIVQANSDSIGTLVFDEIDSGISGKTAAIVGEKLVEVSQTHQVLCISHLAQICALGDQHYLIEKNTEDQLTTTRIRPLIGDGRISEIARILGGAHVSSASLKASEELLKNGETLRLHRDSKGTAVSADTEMTTLTL